MRKNEQGTSVHKKPVQDGFSPRKASKKLPFYSRPHNLLSRTLIDTRTHVQTATDSHT